MRITTAINLSGAIRKALSEHEFFKSYSVKVIDFHKVSPISISERSTSRGHVEIVDADRTKQIITSAMLDIVKNTACRIYGNNTFTFYIDMTDKKELRISIA